MSLSDATKVALVTGGGSGIGLGVSVGLARQNILVLVSDINLSAAQATVEQIISQGGQAEAVALDITQQQQIDQVAADVQARFGRLDVLVNNAGIQHVAKLEDFPVDKWRLITDVLLIGPAMLTRAFLPMMKANNHGRIINIGSIHGLMASPFKSAYVSAKHGIIGFSKVIALEVAEFDITINTICPAYVKTPLVEQQIASTAIEHGISEEQVINTIMLAPMPKKSFIGIEEISGSVDYLIGPATKNMTAQTIVLDGGWLAR